MEKMIKWEASEAMQMQAIDQEKLQILAQIGALMMDLDTAKKNLETVNGKQKIAIQQIASNHGVNQIESARPVPGGIVLQVPDKREKEIIDGPLS